MHTYWRFHVQLLDVKAKLWRRILIRKNATFADLHAAIQDACGWQDYHLYAFKPLKGKKLIAGLVGEEMDLSDPSAVDVKLASYFGPDLQTKCIYQYDFGDDWHHEVTLEGIEQHAERFDRRLVDGAGVFPREDCGGTYGYEQCVAAATGNGWLKEYGDDQARRELLEWLEGWRPDSFDLNTAKSQFDELEREREGGMS